jgi:hypothetical protein
MPLHEKFILNIRGGTSYNQINLKIFNVLTGTILCEKSAGPFGSIHVKN